MFRAGGAQGRRQVDVTASGVSGGGGGAWTRASIDPQLPRSWPSTYQPPSPCRLKRLLLLDCMILRNSRRRQTVVAQSLRASLPRAQDPQCSQSCASRAASLQMQVRTARNAAPERLAVQSVKSHFAVRWPCHARESVCLLASCMPCPRVCLLPPCRALSIIILRAKANPLGNLHPSPPRAPIAHRPCVVTCTQNLLCRWATRTLACFLLPQALRGPMASLCLDRVGSID